MSSNALDISWQVLRQIVHDWAGASADLAQTKPLHGGSINTTLLLQTSDGQKAVLKITPHRVDRAHADEAVQLEALRAAGLPVPRVYRCHIGTLEHPFSYLLLEFMEGLDLAAAKACCAPEAFDGVQTHLAELLLQLHSHTGPHYMRVCSTESKRFDDWPQCYWELYDPIWHDAEKSGLLPVKSRKIVGRLHERLARYLAHGDCPRLIHSDVWSSNLLAKPDRDGRWRISAVLDPNCKYAHCESELAYMELFHTVTPAFLRAYQHAKRLPTEYHTVRKPIYQLYEMLNHLCLFGQEYVRPATAAIERVAPLV